MDPHEHVGKVVGSFTLVERKDRPRHKAEMSGDSGVGHINYVVVGLEEISIDKGISDGGKLGEGSGQARFDKQTLSEESFDLSKICCEGEETAKECHETIYFSVDSPTKVSCMDENVVERHFTEVRQTTFLDSHEFQPPTRLIDPSQIKKGKQIGEGGQATIHEAYCLGHEDEKYVLKVFKVGPGSSSQGQWPDAIFGMPNVCNFIGYILQSNGSYAILMAQYDGDLRTFIDERMQRNKCKGWKVLFNDVERIRLILPIAMGMKRLHAQGLSHRDLKTSNILIHLDSKEPDRMDLADAYISDFECSSNVVGTGFWRSPEVLQALKEQKIARVSEIYTPKSDVYSFGMMCYEILTGKIPLDEYPRSQYDVVLSMKKRPQLPEDLHPKWKDLINRCWHQDPSKRPTFIEIVCELKQFANTIDGGYGRALSFKCGCDEGFGGEGFTLEADLNELQSLLQANQVYLSVEGFASGCDVVANVSRFQQHFGFGITNNMIVNDEEWWELYYLTLDKLECLLDDCEAFVDGKNITYVIGRTMAHWTQLIFDSAKNMALEGPLCSFQFLKV